MVLDFQSGSQWFQSLHFREPLPCSHGRPTPQTALHPPFSPSDQEDPSHGAGRNGRIWPTAAADRPRDRRRARIGGRPNGLGFGMVFCWVVNGQLQGSNSTEEGEQGHCIFDGSDPHTIPAYIKEAPSSPSQVCGSIGHFHCQAVRCMKQVHLTRMWVFPTGLGQGDIGFAVQEASGRWEK